MHERGEDSTAADEEGLSPHAMQQSVGPIYTDLVDPAITIVGINAPSLAHPTRAQLAASLARVEAALESASAAVQAWIHCERDSIASKDQDIVDLEGQPRGGTEGVVDGMEEGVSSLQEHCAGDDDGAEADASEASLICQQALEAVHRLNGSLLSHKKLKRL